MEINKIYNESCLTTLARFPDNSLDCVVSSPPYFNLRDYGIDGQIGLEKEPNEYIKKLTEVFEEIRRALKPEGTCWINIGDTYAANRTYQVHNTKGAKAHTFSEGSKVPKGLKPKDLIGVPWKLAFSLQEAGWWLRNDIIWNRPNVCPESVKDRLTKCHEYVFLLTKSAKYYFDYLSIREKGVIPAGTKAAKGSVERFNAPGVNSRPPEYKVYDGFRNKRDVWTIKTKPFKGAHFAVMPEELVEPCIKAGCPEGGVVYDPFLGAGTVAVVAKKLNRNYIGSELNPEYCVISENRLKF